MIIETERLIIRKFMLDDAEEFFEMNTDPEVKKYLPMEKCTSVEDAKMSIQKNVLVDYAQHGFGRMVVTLKDTGEFIGFNGLKHEKDFGGVDIGFRFKKKFWGQGFATESALPFMKIAFEELNLDRVWGGAMPNNTGSINVLTKLGLEYQKDMLIENQVFRVYALENPKK